MTQMKAWQAVEAGMALGVEELHGPVFATPEDQPEFEPDTEFCAACGVGVTAIGVIGTKNQAAFWKGHSSLKTLLLDTFPDDERLYDDIVAFYEGLRGDGTRHTHIELRDWLKEQDR